MAREIVLCELRDANPSSARGEQGKCGKCRPGTGRSRVIARWDNSFGELKTLQKRRDGKAKEYAGK